MAVDNPCILVFGAMVFYPPNTKAYNLEMAKTPFCTNNPENYDGADRREMLNYLNKLNGLQADYYGDPEVDAKLAQYEMAFRMQTSIPEVMDMSDEPDEVFELYGKDSREAGTFAANCLMARKLLEKDVKFVQLYHQDWETSSLCPMGFKPNAKRLTEAVPPHYRPQTQGLIRRYASYLGRRIWKDGLLARKTLA
jgi:hypothetical protein